MAEKTINTRILLKYDTYENWVSNNPVLKAGEVAIATLETNKDGVQSAPTVLIKVGDGTNTYTALKFISGMAADVYSWAKESKKPDYAASEIVGLSDFISGEIQDTDTQYQIVKVDDYNYKLQSKALGGSWADVSGGAIVIPKYDDTALAGRVTSLEGLVGSTAVATQIANAISALDLANTYAAKSHTHQMSEVNGLETALAGKQAVGDYATKSEAQGYADAKDSAIAEAKKAGTDAAEALETYKTANDGVIDAIKNGTSIDSFADVESALAGKVNNGALDSAIADAKKAGTDAQADVDALETVVDGKADKATTLAGYGITDGMTATEIEQAIEDAQYDDTALAGRVTTVEGKVTTLIGSDSGKSVRTIASEELAAQLIADGAKDSLNTLEEIAAWIQDHPDDASAMNSAITALQAQLTGIAAGNGTVKKYVDDAISALNIGQYALAADLTALAARVTTLEGSAVQTVTANTGLTATKSGTGVTIGLDDTVTFILDCGDSDF